MTVAGACWVQAKFAKQSGVEIIPVVVQGGGWQASGWLGLLTAGSLWTPMHDEATFESNVRVLHGQIEQLQRQSSVSAGDMGDDADECVAPTTVLHEATEELARLRNDLVPVTAGARPGGGGGGGTAEFVTADATQPATIPAGVPKLPVRFQSSEQIRTLTDLVLSTDSSDMALSRVGFFGMGGACRFGLWHSVACMCALVVCAAGVADGATVAVSRHRENHDRCRDCEE